VLDPDLVIAMPTRGRISEPTRYALANHTGPHRLLTIEGLPVDEARNELARRVLALNPVPEFVVWLDDDAYWVPGGVESLVGFLAQNPHVAMVATSFSPRIPYTSAMAWREAGKSALIPVPPGAPGGNCTWADVVPIAECGLHACAIRTSALRALGDDPFTPTDVPEDLAFCRRLKSQGFEIVCVAGLAFLHFDVDTGLAYAPAQPPMRIEGGKHRLVEQREFPYLDGLPGVLVDKRKNRIRFELNARSYGRAVDKVNADIIMNASHANDPA
jgi:hypothetical protein